ncbi:MAG: hypothetical protein VKK59_07150 [Vampirovibrionales bacterium]|nr:hypothetical protein [Vampirovibrionales bacterium]
MMGYSRRLSSFGWACMCWALLTCLPALMGGLAPFSWCADARSRLQDLVVQPPQAFFPDRLVAGESVPLVLKGPVGRSVTVTLTDNESQSVVQNESAQLNEAGVLRVMLAVPNEKRFIGKTMTIKALMGSEPFALVGSDGQSRADGQLTVVQGASSGKGINFLPSLPGMPPGFLQQLQNTASAIEKSNQQEASSTQPERIQDNGVPLNNPFVRVGGNSVGSP